MSAPTTCVTCGGPIEPSAFRLHQCDECRLHPFNQETNMPETRTISPAAREHDRHRLDGTPGNLRCLCDGPQVFAFVDEWQWHEHVVQAVRSA